MALALTVFGVVADGLDPTLCYVLLRTVRGPGEYPAPTLPKGTAADGVSRVAIPNTAVSLITYDAIVRSADEAMLLDELSKGRLTVPAESPIAGGATITELPFGPVIVTETSQKARVSGVGLLYRKGIATDNIFKVLREALDRSLAPGTVPEILQALIAKITELSGMLDIFISRRPLGVVDYFYRAPAKTYIDGPFFDVVPDMPDFQTKAPVLRVHVRRHAAPLDQNFRFGVTLGNFDDILCSSLLEIESGAKEIVVSAPAHITDVSLKVFDDAGHLVDELNGKFTQAMNFGLSASGAIDTLPSPFAGAPKSPDLQARPRIHTIAFQGPSIAGRSGGLDVLRKLDANVAACVGPLSPKFENVWFERGAEGQLAVIRWIKKKIEQPGLAKAFFVDPYLGSEALQRVVARQGNETAALMIVVSPGNFDPDAEAAATAAGSDYLVKLTQTATSWADKLAGHISIVHVRRGDGSRQAFHDRYLCTVDQSGVPTVYLLSNSLSKAAGDWPFAICELDRVMSWRVYAYILEMVEGRAKDRGLEPELIWKSANTPATRLLATSAPATDPGSAPPWAAAANAFLTEIRAIIIRNSEFKSQVAARIAAFLRDWPQDMDVVKLADPLFKVVSHRDAIVVFVSDRLREGGRVELADMLDERLLEQFLDLLPPPEQKGGWFVPFDARRVVVENLGKTIARKQNATNFVRGRLNPKVYELVALIESQRFDETLTWEAHEASLFLSFIALEVAMRAEAPESHRVGLATDYIHWLGRLMRSDAAASIYVARDTIPPEWLDDLVAAVHAVAVARQTLGGALNAPIGRVMDDPLVAPIFKNKLSSFLADGGTAAFASQ